MNNSAAFMASARGGWESGQPLLRLAILAVLGVDSAVLHVDGNPFERPTLAVRIHPHRDRCARREAGGEQLVRVRTCIAAANRIGLVSGPLMPSIRNDLSVVSNAGLGNPHRARLEMRCHFHDLCPIFLRNRLGRRRPSRQIRRPE